MYSNSDDERGGPCRRRDIIDIIVIVPMCECIDGERRRWRWRRGASLPPFLGGCDFIPRRNPAGDRLPIRTYLLSGRIALPFGGARVGCSGAGGRAASPAPRDDNEILSILSFFLAHFLAGRFTCTPMLSYKFIFHVDKKSRESINYSSNSTPITTIFESFGTLPGALQTFPRES